VGSVLRPPLAELEFESEKLIFDKRKVETNRHSIKKSNLENTAIDYRSPIDSSNPAR